VPYSHALASEVERHKDPVLEEGDSDVEAHQAEAGRSNQREGIVGLPHIEDQALEVVDSNWGWGGIGCQSAWGQAEEKAGRACSFEARRMGHGMHKDHREPHLRSLEKVSALTEGKTSRIHLRSRSLSASGSLGAIDWNAVSYILVQLWCSALTRARS